MITANSPATAVEFLPLPPKGQCPVFGISRSGFYQLEKAGEIRFIRVKKRGNILGRTLVVADSVRRYFARLDSEQNANAKCASNIAATATAAAGIGEAEKTEGSNTHETAAA